MKNSYHECLSNFTDQLTEEYEKGLLTVKQFGFLVQTCKEIQKLCLKKVIDPFLPLYYTDPESKSVHIFIQFKDAYIQMEARPQDESPAIVFGMTNGLTINGKRNLLASIIHSLGSDHQVKVYEN